MHTDPAEIKPYLFLGSAVTASDMDKLGSINCKYIINVAMEIDNYFESDSELTYLKLDLDDSIDQDLSGHFDRVFEVLEKAKDESAVAFIHCQAGISRSASFVIAYLISKYDMSLADAFEHVRSRKPNISPNIGFWEQLGNLEVELGRERSSSLNELLLHQLLNMGFQEDISKKALEESGSDIDLALSICLNPSLIGWNK